MRMCKSQEEIKKKRERDGGGEEERRCHKLLRGEIIATCRAWEAVCVCVCGYKPLHSNALLLSPWTGEPPSVCSQTVYKPNSRSAAGIRSKHEDNGLIQYREETCPPLLHNGLIWQQEPQTQNDSNAKQRRTERKYVVQHKINGLNRNNSE